MNKRPYSGAYSQRRFSNYTATRTTEYNLSVTSGEPTMGDVGVIKLASFSAVAAENDPATTVSNRGAQNESYDTYRAVAKAKPGYRFVQWQTNIDGIGNTNTNPLEFKLTKNTWLIARFEAIEYNPTTSKTAHVSWDGTKGRVNGNGLVLDNTGRANSGTITAAQGATVNLTATPLDGFKFVRWVGVPVDGKTDPTVTFNMNNNYNITAEFAAANANQGTGYVVGGADPSSTVTTTAEPTNVSPATTESKVKAFVKKWWWAILIVAYVVYKERKGGK